MAKVYRDEDADLGVLHNKTIAVIGFGNQGRMQALNLRDSGAEVIVGGREDAYLERAEAEGFVTYSVDEAAKRGDILLFLLPDEVQPAIYKQSIKPALAAGKVLDFASGYNLAFGLIKPPHDVDVVMVAPRMIGEKARQLYQAGKGAPAMISVENNASDDALAYALAIAKGIGATRAGAFEGSARMEAEMDLFAEQVLWAGLMEYMKMAFEVGVQHGFDPELLVLEMTASGEMAEIATAMAEQGFFKQMALHSHTSQYGTLSRGPRLIAKEIRNQMKKHLEDEIASGQFAQEWTQEQREGMKKFDALRKKALDHPFNIAEESLFKLWKNRE